MGIVGGAALQAGGGVISNIIGGLFNANQAAKDRAFQERMYNKQYEDSIKFWNMQNEYNLPSAVYQRELEGMRANGLNPMLMYGQAGPQSVATGQPQLPSQPHGGHTSASFSNPFEGFALLGAQSDLLKAQSENLRSDSALKTAQALTEAEKTIREREEGKKASSEAFFNMASWRERLKSINRENQYKESMSLLNDELRKTEPEKRKQIIEEQKLISKQYEVCEAQIDDFYNQMNNRDRITTAQINKFNKEVEVMINKAAHEFALMDAQAREHAAHAFILEIEGAVKSLPEWQAAEVLKQLGEAEKVFYEGDEQNIKAVLARYMWDTMPKYDESSYSYRKWLKNYAEPTTKAIGNILGGSGAATIGLLK